MITLAEVTEAFKNASEQDRRAFIELTAPYFIEKIQTIVDDSLFDIDLQLCKIEEKIEHGVNINPMKEIKEPTITMSTTTLDKKAEALVTHLQTDVKPNWGKEIVMCASDIYSFFTEKVKDSLRWPVDLKNKRQTKLEIIERAAKMYPGIVEIVSDKSGNKTKGIALKAYSKCRRTDTC